MLPPSWFLAVARSKLFELVDTCCYNFEHKDTKIALLLCKKAENALL
jgi:hypothetical protein